VDSKRCKSNPCPTLYGSTGGSAAAALILFLILFVLVMFVLRRNSLFDRVVQLLPEK
jgi:ABC-type sugar transport system permease subunit